MVHHLLIKHFFFEFRFFSIENSLKIVITICGEHHLEQSLMTIKSAVILTQSKLHFIIFTDELNQKAISQNVSS